jgi:hypothetical protein
LSPSVTQAGTPPTCSRLAITNRPDSGKDLLPLTTEDHNLDPLDNVEMSEAEEMSRLARGLFTYLYEMPAKLARSRAAAPGGQPEMLSGVRYQR